jgi:DNA-binding PadR family transcriptional regulator
MAASSSALVLSILAGGDSYGYQIIRSVRDLSRERIEWSDGMLYPVLHRLQKQGLIEAYLDTSATGRERKYYRLKKEGTQALAEHRSQWTLVHNTLQQLWETKPCLT